MWLLTSTRRNILIFTVLCLQLSCKKLRTRTHANSEVRSAQYGLLTAEIIEQNDIEDFYKRVFGDVHDTYWRNWADLNTYPKGEVKIERIPYMDSWYPEKSTGTNVNGALTKYDQAFYKGQDKAAKWERTYNNRTSPSWYGHCNGTSVAASRFQNPLTSVGRPAGCEEDPNVNCVIFTPSDIRALLAEINMNAKSKFVAGNRCRKTQAELDALPEIRLNPTTQDSCEDVNPGNFHIALINFLGRKRQPLIFDHHRDNQVWNYPIYEYSYKSEGPLSEQEAIKKLDLPIDRWIFNPNAKSWYFITMNISYRKARSDFEGAGTKPSPTQISYTYLLELDSQENVIGGEWTGDSRRSHPDFLWMAFEPDEPTGTASRGNPHVSNSEVIGMWAESVGLDPSSPFRDKPKNTYDIRFYPTQDLEWGIVKGYYSAILDGNNRGVAFLGKKTQLKIQVEDVLANNVELDVFLNGKSLGRKKPSDKEIDIEFDSPRGLNYLNLKWYVDHVDARELDREFRYYAM